MRYDQIMTLKHFTLAAPDLGHEMYTELARHDGQFASKIVEPFVTQELGWTPAPKNQKGYDAILPDGSTNEIRTRADNTGSDFDLRQSSDVGGGRDNKDGIILTDGYTLVLSHNFPVLDCYFVPTSEISRVTRHNPKKITFADLKAAAHLFEEGRP